MSKLVIKQLVTSDQMSKTVAQMCDAVSTYPGHLDNFLDNVAPWQEWQEFFFSFKLCPANVQDSNMF